MASYLPLSSGKRIAALAIFAAGLACALIPAAQFGESPRYKLSPEAARAAADAFVRAQGADPGAYRFVTFPEVHWGGEDSLAGKYFLEHRSLSATSRLFQQYRPVQYWAVRYFKSLEKEEWLVTVQPESGKILGFSHALTEDRAGADLTADAARQIAAAFAGAHGLDVEAMDLKESKSDKRKARRDYSLEWEARQGDPRNVDETHYRVAIGVAGDQVASMRVYWKVPEAFERNRDRQNLVSIGVLAITIATMVGAIVFGLWTFIVQIRKGQVPWRRTLQLAAIPTVMTAITLALSVHMTLYRGYQTVIPWETFVVTTSVVLAMGVAFAYVMYGAAGGFVLTFFPESMAAFRRERRAMVVDSIVLLLLAVGLWHICHQLASLLTDRLHALAILDVGTPSLIGLPAPSLEAAANAVRSVFSRAAMLAVLVLAWQRVPKRWMLIPITLLAVCSSVSGDVRTAGEFGLEYLLALSTAAAALLFCGWFARRNYLAYVLAIWLAALYPALAELLHSGNGALLSQGWILAAFALAGIVWAVWPRLTGDYGM